MRRAINNVVKLRAHGSNVHSGDGEQMSLLLFGRPGMTGLADPNVFVVKPIEGRLQRSHVPGPEGRASGKGGQGGKCKEARQQLPSANQPREDTLGFTAPMLVAGVERPGPASRTVLVERVSRATKERALVVR